MPKKSIPIPNWLKELKYPDDNSPEEFAYQIFLRRALFKGSWTAGKNWSNNQKAMGVIQEVLCMQTLLRDSFKTLMSAATQINKKDSKPILTNIMQTEAHIDFAGLSQLSNDYIPNGTPIIGINLQHSNEDILRSIEKHLKILRRRNLPVRIIDDDAFILPKNKSTINDIYNRPHYYLEKWKNEKTLQAFDLALWRAISGDALTIAEIVSFLGLQDDNQWRKTTLKKLDEIMLPGVVEAIICGINQLC